MKLRNLKTFEGLFDTDEIVDDTNPFSLSIQEFQKLFEAEFQRIEATGELSNLHDIDDISVYTDDKDIIVETEWTDEDDYHGDVECQIVIKCNAGTQEMKYWTKVEQEDVEDEEDEDDYYVNQDDDEKDDITGAEPEDTEQLTTIEDLIFALDDLVGEVAYESMQMRR